MNSRATTLMAGSLAVIRHQRFTIKILPPSNTYLLKTLAPLKNKCSDSTVQVKSDIIINLFVNRYVSVAFRNSVNSRLFFFIDLE